MAESPSSPAVPMIDQSALARRVMETLLQGGTITECASDIDEFGGSLLAVYECLDRGMDRGLGAGAVRRIVRQQQEARAVRLETLKTAAMHELWLMAFGEDDRRRGLTADGMRAIEARRRACVSLLQLKPFPNVPGVPGVPGASGVPGTRGARDSSQDIPSPRFFDDGRTHSPDDCAIGSGWDDELRTTSYESDVAVASKLEIVQQLARTINRNERARADFEKCDAVDIDAIAAVANDSPIPPAPDTCGSTSRLTRQQIRKQARDQRKQESKNASGAVSDTSDPSKKPPHKLETCRNRVTGNCDRPLNAECVVDADKDHPP